MYQYYFIWFEYYCQALKKSRLGGTFVLLRGQESHLDRKIMQFSPVTRRIRLCLFRLACWRTRIWRIVVTDFHGPQRTGIFPRHYPSINSGFHRFSQMHHQELPLGWPNLSLPCNFTLPRVKLTCSHII